MIEKPRKFHDKHRMAKIATVLLGLLILLMTITIARPFEARYVVFRLSTKVFVAFEGYHLKYPDSHLIESETRYTSKVTVATFRTYSTSDDITAVLDYFEQDLSDFVPVKGSLVEIEPTYRNELSADVTGFNSIFQALGSGMPYIEIYVFPSNAGGTTIQINEHWSSMGIPSWLVWVCR